jgi:hypothetical protein
VFSRLSRLVVILAAVQLLGGYWFALQSVAWIGMFAHYSHDGELLTAITKTFDGQHPCDLCNVVKNGRAQEQKQQTAKMTVKLEAIIAPAVSAPAPRSMAPEYSVSVPSLSPRNQSPPTPPPRAA